jgi:hypothetical protein
MNRKELIKYISISILITIILITISQILAEIINPQQEGLTMIGYHFNTNGWLSITLQNNEKISLTITHVYFDENELSKGIIGYTIPLGGIYISNTSKNILNIPTNDIIFPPYGYYNIRQDSQFILPKTIITLYADVGPQQNNSNHTLVITTNTNNTYLFILIVGHS